MAPDSAKELVEAIRGLDDDAKAAIGKELAPHIPVTLGRRGMLGVGAAALLGAGGATGAGRAVEAGVGQAAAAEGVVNDVDVFKSGDGSVMTAGNAIQQANEAVSTATTIGNVCYIEVDTTVSGFTVTIPAALEVSGMEIRFLDAGGSAGSNSYNIDSANWNIDGSATKTIDTSDTVTVLYSAGDRWISNGFIDSVDAGEASFTNETDVFAEADTTVSIGSAATFTSPSFGTEVRDERNEFDNSNDQFSPDKDGLYFVSGVAQFRSGDMSDQDRLQARLQDVTAGTTVRRDPFGRASGTAEQIVPPFVGVFELSASQTYEFQVRNLDSPTDIDSDGSLTIRSAFRET